MATVQGGTLVRALMDLWPNPSRDGMLNLAFVGVEMTGGQAQVEMTDAMGRSALVGSITLSDGSPSTLDVSSLASGLYTMHAIIGTQSFVERVVLE